MSTFMSVFWQRLSMSRDVSLHDKVCRVVSLPRAEQSAECGQCVVQQPRGGRLLGQWFLRRADVLRGRTHATAAHASFWRVRPKQTCMLFEINWIIIIKWYGQKGSIFVYKHQIVFLTKFNFQRVIDFWRTNFMNNIITEGKVGYMWAQSDGSWKI